MVRGRATAYERGQHTLICDALQVSADPNAPGLTAYEAVCVLMMKLDIAVEAIRETLRNNKHLADGENCTLIELKRAGSILRRKPESFDVLPLYGTEVT